MEIVVEGYSRMLGLNHPFTQGSAGLLAIWQGSKDPSPNGVNNNIEDCRELN